MILDAHFIDAHIIIIINIAIVITIIIIIIIVSIIISIVRKAEVLLLIDNEEF